MIEKDKQIWSVVQRGEAEEPAPASYHAVLLSAELQKIRTSKIPTGQIIR